MGLFDNFFKSKSPPSEETSVETGAEPAKRSDAAARGSPPHRADPSAFLHPKSFVPRDVSPLSPPAKSGAISGVRKPGSSPAPAAAEEIVLTLGDVLSRIPTHYLKAGQHDAKRELRFSINDLSSDIARGRAAVPLSRIAQLMPDIFVKQIGRDEDTEVRLPLQKLVEQIGLLRSRPLGYSSDRAGRLPAPPAPLPAPDAKAHFPTPMMEVTEPARESLRDLLVNVEPVFELKPAEDAAAAAASGPEPVMELKPVAPESPAAPEIPASIPPLETLFAPSPPIAAPAETPIQSVVAMPPLGEMPAGVSAVLAEPAPLPVAEVTPQAVETPALPAETPPALPSEPILPSSQTAIPVEPTIPEPVAQEAPEAAEVGGERIQLSLAAILRQCPREIIVGELPTVPDNVRISLPFAPIDRQLVMGQVEVSAVRFVAALPFAYQKYFAARMGVKVPIPLEEVFQNLPNPANEEPAASGPPPQILAPAAPDAVLSPTGDAPAPSVPTADSGPLGEKPLSPLAPEAPTAPEIATNGTAPVEPPPSPAPPPLDLPAFHHFMPPPPIIAPDHIAPAAVAPVGLTELLREASAQPQDDAFSFEAALPAPSPAIPVLPVVELPVDLIPETPVVSGPPAASEGESSEPSLPLDPPVEASAPPSESASSSVFAKATQTIQPPQMVRPFIVLPPPIFAFQPSPSIVDGNGSQDSNGEDVANEITTSAEIGVGSQSDEQAPLGVLPPEASVLPGIISIDFSQALVAPDEPPVVREMPLVEVSDLPSATPVEVGPETAPLSATPVVPEPFVPVAEPFVPPAGEIVPPSVGAEASALPLAEKPLEAPSGAITFIAAGHFIEPLPAPAAPAPPESAPDIEAEATTPEPAPAEEPAPLLTLPRLVPEFSPTDVLPPPALPFRRFDQDALQALFMTEEVLDLTKISRLAAQLPGVHACVIATRDQACTGGKLPEGFDLAALLGLAPRVGEAAGRMPIGSLKHFTLYGDQYSVSFFERNGLSLCAVHRPRSFVPGVREKLVAIADELSK